MVGGCPRWECWKKRNKRRDESWSPASSLSAAPCLMAAGFAFSPREHEHLGRLPVFLKPFIPHPFNSIKLAFSFNAFISFLWAPSPSKCKRHICMLCSLSPPEDSCVRVFFAAASDYQQSWSGWEWERGCNVGNGIVSGERKRRGNLKLFISRVEIP